MQAPNDPSSLTAAVQPAETQQAVSSSAEAPNEARGGSSRAAAGSAASSIYVYLYNSQTMEVIDKITYERRLAGRMDVVNAAIDKLIERNNGIKAGEKIRFTLQSPEELHLPCQW